MLAIITRMTLTQVRGLHLVLLLGLFLIFIATMIFLSSGFGFVLASIPCTRQVSTWFANARRRLKKENKVTWSPRACKNSDDRTNDGDSDEAEKPLKCDNDLPGKQSVNDSTGSLKVWSARPDLVLSPSSIITDNVQCADLQSDLEDFDLLESDASDCEPKSEFLPEDSDANPNTDSKHGHHERTSEPLHGKDPTSPHCAKRENHAFCSNPDLGNTHIKPKIWSIADTASLDEYPPCMLASTGSSSSAFPLNMCLTKQDRQQESPVATLREWVDGVFLGPPFQQPRPAEAWKGLSDDVVDSRTPGQSFETVRRTSSLLSN